MGGSMAMGVPRFIIHFERWMIFPELNHPANWGYPKMAMETPISDQQLETRFDELPVVIDDSGV